jgi:hypothetical protein
MAPGFLVHQRKRLRRSRSLIVFGPEAISVIVKNADFACAELLSQRSIHGAQFLRCQPGQGHVNLAHGAHEITITSPGSPDKRIVSWVWREACKRASVQASVLTIDTNDTNDTNEPSDFTCCSAKTTQQRWVCCLQCEAGRSSRLRLHHPSLWLGISEDIDNANSSQPAIQTNTPSVGAVTAAGHVGPVQFNATPRRM